MKRKILSIVLTLATLVGCFACFAPAAGAATEAPASSSKSSASYLDLYVKDGLVALFDAYGAAAADGDVTTWQPVNFYGKAGYSSYADPSSYTTSLVKGSNLGWKWEDGYLSHYWHTDPGDRCKDDDSVFNIDEVGALLADDYDYTVQAVYQYVLPYNEKQSSAPIIEGNTITNFANLGAGTGSGCFLMLKAAPVKIGDFEITYLWYYPYLTNWNINRIGIYYEQMPDNRNYLYTSEYYTGAKPADLVDENGTAIASPFVQMSPETGVFERSFIRTSATSITIHDYSPIPRWHGGGYGSNDLTLSVNNTASTKMHLLGDAAQRAYSVRVYNKVLTDAEINRNHLADLCGYYGIDVSGILAMSDADIATLANAAKDIKIARVVSEKEDLKRSLLDAIGRMEPAPDLSAEERQMTDYDKLYIGADGVKSENGAGLIALYSAYIKDEKSVDLTAGIWYNKVDTIDAALIGGPKSSDNTDGWTWRTAGVGYDLGIDYGTVNKYMVPQNTDNKLTLDPGLLSSSDFTVEYAAAFPEYILPDGTGYGTGSTHMARVPEDLCGEPSDRIGYLGNYATRAGNISSTGSSVTYNGAPVREMRWYVGKPSENLSSVYMYRVGNWGSGQNLWGDMSRSTVAPYVQSFTRDETESAAGISAKYTIFSNGNEFSGGTWQSNAGEKSFYWYPVSETNYVFELFRKVPTTVYSVRVYNGVLTQAELRHNRLIDLAAYYGADLSAYEALSREERTIVDGVMAEFPFTSDKATFEEEILSVASNFEFTFDYTKTLYVKDGLTVLLSGYNSLDTGTFRMNDTSLLWYNGVTEGTFATLKGTNWHQTAGGGYTIVKTLDDYNYNPSVSALYNTKEDYALVLDGAMIPEASYTVEYVANPVGISNIDGTRYVDLASKAGIYHENAVAIGPLRAMQFNAARSEGGYFERRWVYGRGDQPYIDAVIAGTSQGGRGNLSGFTYDTAWQGFALEQIVTSAITLDTLGGNHVYCFYQDNEYLGQGTVKYSAVISPAKADNMFRLMGGFAGTIYSVRVYNRVLSEKERVQNHFADLVYYYDIDISAIEGAMSAMGDISAIAAPFADMGFDMEKTEAQEYFNSRMAVIWLSYQNYAVRADKSEGLRYYFDLSWTGINAMLSADVAIEIGAIVNVGKSADPVLDGYGYDYRITAFDSVAGKYNGFFVDDDTFAVTVRYHDSSREALLTDVRVFGYVKLTLSDGTSAVYYLNTTDSAPDNHFEAYNSATKNESSAVVTNVELYNYALGRIEYCYSDVYVYLDAAAAEGGDGSKDAPYKYFEDAFAKLKSIMQTMTAPSHVTLLAKDGFYSVSEEQKLTEEDCVYPHNDITITSSDGGAVLSSLKDMTGEFTSLGGNLYSYQFEKDANGNYPSFRYLYVDGEIADLAHNSAPYTYLDDALFTAFNRDFEGVYETAKDLAKAGKLDFNTMPTQYASRPDLKERFQYYVPYFIALYEVAAVYDKLPATTNYSQGSAQLASATPTKGSNATYKSAFETYKAMYLGRYEAECAARLYGPRSTAFLNSTSSSTNSQQKSTYASAMAHIRYQASYVYWSDSVIAPYEITVTMTADGKALDKYYLSENVLGDLSALMEEGKAKMLAYAAALEAETTEALANANAALAAAQATAADALLIYNTVLSLKDTAEGDLIATVDALITEAKAAYDAAAEADKHDASLVLSAYEGLKAALKTDGVKASYDAHLAVLLENAASTEKARVAASGDVKTATNEKVSADELIVELRDERFWMKHALEPYNIEVNFVVQYTYNELKLLGVDYDDLYVLEKDGTTETYYACYLEKYQHMSIPQGGSGAHPLKDHLVFAMNALLYADTENEYYYDETTGTLYYYTAEGVEGKSFAHPTADRLLTFLGVDNLTVSNLSFTGADDYHRTENSIAASLCMGDHTVKLSYSGGFPDRAAIYVADAYNLDILDCSFYQLGCEGITARGWMQDVRIDGNSFETIGSAGIRLGENVRPADGMIFLEGTTGNKDIAITDNYLHNISTMYSSPAMMVTTAENGVIKNNTVDDCPYSCIVVGWWWGTREDLATTNLSNVEISYNFVTSFMRNTHDGGAIYVAGANSNKDNVEMINSVHHNCVLYSSTTGDGLGSFAAGLYFDNASSNYEVYENVIVAPAYGAADGETDYDKYGITAEEAAYMKATRNGATLLYLQHISQQEVYNITLKDNYIVNVRATTDDDKITETYKTYLAAGSSRNVVDKKTHYVKDVSSLPREVGKIIGETGAYKHMGDPDAIVDNVY